jgi:hypothetical protein
MSIKILSEMFPGEDRLIHLNYAFRMRIPGGSALVMSWPVCDGYRIYIYDSNRGREIACHECDSVLQAAGVIQHYLGGNE